MTNQNFFSKRVLLLFVSLFLFLIQGMAQEKEADIYQLTSPYHTIYAFLANLQSDNFHPDIAAKALHNAGYSEKEKKELAIKLIQILDGKGLLVNLDELPKENNYKDSTTNKARYVLFAGQPEIYVEKYGNIWLFSLHTVKNINKLHQKVYPFGLDKLLELIPQGANKKFLGLTTWQYVGLLILIVLTFVLHKVLTFLFGSVLIRLVSRFGQEQIIKKLVQPVAHPASLFLLFWILAGAVPVLGLPVGLNRLMLLILHVSMPVFGIMIASRMVDFISHYMEKRAAKTAGTLDDQLTPLVRKTLKIVVVIVGSLYVLQSLDFDITTLLAGISIGTLAFALAAQDTIKNLFGSITIFLDKPFQVGDWITASEIDGTIEEVGFRSTRVRTFHNSVIYIPNGKMADMTIDNMGLRKFRRYRTMVSVTYDTPPRLIRAFVEGIRQVIKTHPDTNKENYHVYLNNFSGSSLDILFYAFFAVPNWADELRARHEVMLAIIELAEELGVRFAFPTQTLHIEDLPGQKGLTPHYDEEFLKKENLRKKVDNFVNAHFSKPRTPSKHRGDDSGINEADGE